MGQTRQHSLLINLLGVKQIIVGINKMDCDVAKYGEARYNEVRDESMSMLEKVGWKKSLIEKEVSQQNKTEKPTQKKKTICRFHSCQSLAGSATT